MKNNKNSNKDIADLAQLLVQVLTHPQLPNTLEIAIFEGMNDVFNECNSTDIEVTVEYISILIKAHNKKYKNQGNE